MNQKVVLIFTTLAVCILMTTGIPVDEQSNVDDAIIDTTPTVAVHHLDQEKKAMAEQQYAAALALTQLMFESAQMRGEVGESDRPGHRQKRQDFSWHCTVRCTYYWIGRPHSRLPAGCNCYEFW